MRRVLLALLEMGVSTMNYVTYTDLFAFATFVVCVVALFLDNKKK